MTRLRYRATVVGADHESIIVKPDSGSASCALCDSGKGCGGGLLRSWRTPGDVRVFTPAPEIYELGARVMVASDASAIARYALLVYGGPLAVFVACASVLQPHLHELVVAACSLGALLVGFRFAALIARRLPIHRVSWVESCQVN